MSESSLRPELVMRFGVFEVDSRRRELRKRGRRIRLQDKPFEVLSALLDRPGELVSRDSLRKKLWPDNTFVDFDHGLNNAVNRLREALCDSADNPSFIETVPRHGYRFVGSVRIESLPGLPCVEPSEPEPSAAAKLANVPSDASTDLAPAEHLCATVESIGPQVGKLIKRHKNAAILFTAVLLPLIAIQWFTAVRSVEGARIDSIAVLPLANLAAERSEDYFADGMTEELITDLAKVGSFRVISRTSVMRYKNTNRSLAEIGRELNVNALVEGTVRRFGDRVRITVQVVCTHPERNVWADAYEGNIRDVLNLQCDVAKDIVNKIQTKIAASKANNPLPKKRLDPEAYEDYLRGRYFLARRTADTMNKAVGYFRQALQRDPQYAEVYAGLALAYDLLGAYEVLSPEDSFSRVKGFATKALELDGTLAEAYTARAVAASFWEFNWPAATRDFERAIALNPNSAAAHHWYGEHFTNIGKAERAISELKLARELDPLSLPVNSTLGRMYRDAHRYSEAIQQCQKTIELDPNFSMGHWCLAQAYAGQRQYSAAIPELERANALGTTPLLLRDLGYTYAAVGKKMEARAVLNTLQQKAQFTYVPPYLIAAIYVGLGEKDEAFRWLKRAYDKRDAHITNLALDPEMDPLRSDPRFPALLQRLNIAQ